jgi:hypothetical protein
MRELRIYKKPENKSTILEYLSRKKRRKELDISDIEEDRANIISL